MDTQRRLTPEKHGRYMSPFVLWMWVGLIPLLPRILFAAAGDLDSSFDSNGIRVVRLAGSNLGQAVAVQSDGKIVMAGDTTTFGLEDFMVVRLNANGSPDTTFDRDGIRTAGLSGKNLGQGVKIQPDGKIIMVGTTDTFDASDVELMRFLGQ